VAARAVGSLSDSDFEIAFNPDVFQDHVKHAEPEGEKLRREKQLVKDVAEFLLLSQIPGFVSTFNILFRLYHSVTVYV